MTLIKRRDVRVGNRRHTVYKYVLYVILLVQWVEYEWEMYD